MSLLSLEDEKRLDPRRDSGLHALRAAWRRTTGVSPTPTLALALFHLGRPAGQEARGRLTSKARRGCEDGLLGGKALSREPKMQNICLGLWARGLRDQKKISHLRSPGLVP